MNANNLPPVAPFASCPRSVRLLQHQPLVARLARRLSHRTPANVTLGDLMQAGMLGLDQAVTGFEVGHGTEFDTYASQRIQGAMLDELRATDELSRHARARIRKVRTVVQQLENTLGRPPRATEIATKAGLSLQEVHDIRTESNTRTVSFGIVDSDVAENEASQAECDPANAEFFTSEAADPSMVMQRRQEHTAVNTAFSQLKDKDRTLLNLLFQQDIPQQEVAVMMGVTASRVCQLRAEAIKRLKTLVAIDLGTHTKAEPSVKKPRTRLSKAKDAQAPVEPQYAH